MMSSLEFARLTSSFLHTYDLSSYSILQLLAYTLLTRITMEFYRVKALHLHF